MSVNPQLNRLVALALAAQSVSLSCWAEMPSYANKARAYNLAHGRVVFTDKCMRCHETGRKRAPVFGDVDDWADRLEQPLDTLIEHAIVGHGDMPARGDQDISEQDVAAAVAYVVDRTRTILVDQLNALPPTAAGGSEDSAPDPSDQAAVQVFMLILGKERWR